MKKIIITFITVCVLCVSVFQTVEAKPDAESEMYGFEVDDEIYKDVKWYDIGRMSVKTNGYVVGYCTISIGMTRAKSKATDGSYIDHVLVKCAMKGNKAKTFVVGYSESLKIEATPYSGCKLMSVEPRTQTSGTSYSIGVGAGTDGIGISADVSFDRTDLNVRNKSEISVPKVEILYDYIHPLIRFADKSYFYDESIQKAHWINKTRNSAYTTTIKVTAKFELFNAEPSFMATAQMIYASKSKNISIKTPY